MDLCHPLLVGILSDNEEDDVGGTRDGSSLRREVFLCIKQGLALEVDMKHGRERCRLELSSLARVKTTEAAWTRGVRQGNQFKDVFLSVHTFALDLFRHFFPSFFFLLLSGDPGGASSRGASF